MPPALACRFTVSELAVLRIIRDEVRQHGQCARCVDDDEIAARAGVCRRMVQTALREAARLSERSPKMRTHSLTQRKQVPAPG